MTDLEGASKPPRNRSRWVAALVVLALVAGIAVAASQWSRPQPTPAPVVAPDPAGSLPAGHPPLDDTTDATSSGLPAGHAAVDDPNGGTSKRAGASADPGYVSLAGMHALIQAGLPPTNPRVWVDEVVGVDVSGLSATQREIYLRHANAEDCVCGHTIASCRAFNRPCPVGPGKATALLDSVRTGCYTSSDGLRERPRGAVPAGHPSAS